MVDSEYYTDEEIKELNRAVDTEGICYRLINDDYFSFGINQKLIDTKAIGNYQIICISSLVKCKDLCHLFNKVKKLAYEYKISSGIVYNKEYLSQFKMLKELDTMNYEEALAIINKILESGLKKAEGKKKLDDGEKILDITSKSIKTTKSKKKSEEKTNGQIGLFG